jgi:hypothetical protein
MSKIFQRDDYNYIINVDFLTQKELSLNNFHEIFLTIKRKLHIKHSRKSEVDSLLKKAKCKFFQTVHNIMKYCLNITVNRLPQIFITNINIEYNRNYLEKTIIQIYNEFDLIQNVNIIEEIDDNIIRIKNKELFKHFSKFKLYELYEEYIESQCYKKDIDKVKNKNGKNIGILYEFVSKNFIYYYMNNKNKIVKINENDGKEYNNYNKKQNIQDTRNEYDKIISLEE